MMHPQAAPVRWSTRAGYCAIGNHEIEPVKTLPASQQTAGYRSPRPPKQEVYLSTDERGVTRSNYTYIKERLCLRHYLEAYAEVYPDEPLPEGIEF